MDETDFHAMKRKELQALCKKHKIPANLSNLVMANKLSELFKGTETPADGAESDNAVSDRVVKKVRFSPDHELIEFTRSREKRGRGRRKSVLSRNSDSVELYSENVGSPSGVTRSKGLKKLGTRSGKSNKEGSGSVDKLGRGMRLRGKVVIEAVAKASGRGRKRVKGDDVSDDKVLVDEDDDKSTEEVADVPRRVTRSRGQKLPQGMEEGKQEKNNVKSDVPDLVCAENGENKMVSRRSTRKREVVDEEKLGVDFGVNVNDKENVWGCVLESDKDVGKNVVVEPRILLRRSNRKADMVDDSETLIDDAHNYKNGQFQGSLVDVKCKRGETKADEKLQVVLENQGVSKLETRRTRRKSVMPSKEQLRSDSQNNKNVQFNGSVVDVKCKRGKTEADDKLEAVLENQLVSKLEPRRSRRKFVMPSKEQLGSDALKNKNAQFKGSVLDAEYTGSKLEAVLENQEPIKVEPRRITRKSVMPSLEHLGNDDQKAKEKGRYALRNPVLLVETNVGVSNDDKKVPQLGGVSRRSKHNTLNLKPNSTNKAGDTETAKQSSDLCLVDKEIPEVQKNTRRSKRSGLGKDAILQQNNESTKRKRVSISNEDVEFDDSGELTHSIRKTSRNERTSPSYSISKVADEMKQLVILKEPDWLQTSEQVVLTNQDLSSAEMSASKVADSRNNAPLSSDHSAKMIDCDTKLVSNAESHEEIQDGSVRDNAANAEMESNDGNASSKVDENATSRIGVMHEKFTFCGKENSDRVAEQVHSPSLDDDVNELVEEDICITDKNAGATQVNKLTEDYSFQHPTDTNELCLDASNKSSEKFNEDAAMEIDHTCTSEPSGRVNSTDFMNGLDLNEASSGKMRRYMEDDYKAEADKAYMHNSVDSEFVETDKGRSLDNGACDGENEFCLSNLFDCEKSAGITPTGKGFSSEYSIKESDDHGLNTALNNTSEKINENVAIEIEDTCTSEPSHSMEASSGKTRRDMKDGDTAEADEAKRGSDFVETEGENEFCPSNLLDSGKNAGVTPKGEVFAVEYSVKESGEQEANTALNTSAGKINVDATTATDDTCFLEPCEGCVYFSDAVNALDEASSEKTRRIDMEDDHIAKADEIYVHNTVDSNFIETDEGRSLQNCKGESDGDNEFFLSKLFDCEKSAGVTPKDKGFSGEYSIRESDEQKQNNASKKSPQEINEDAALEIEEACYSELHEEQVNSPDQMNTLNLKEASSGKTRSRGMEDNFIAIADETYVHDTADSGIVETDEGQSLQNCKGASDGDNAFCLYNLFDCEKSAGTTPKDKEFSGEYSITESDEQEVNTASKKCPEENNEDAVLDFKDACSSELHEGRVNFTDQMNTLDLKEASSGKPRSRSMEDDYLAEADEAEIHRGQDSVVESDEGGSLQYCKGACDGENDFYLSKLFDGEKSAGVTPKVKGFSGECIRESDEQEMFHNSPAAVQPDMCSETMLSEGYKADTTEEISICVRPELLKNDEGGFIKDHEEESEKIMEYAVGNHFDGEHSATKTPQNTAYCSEESDDKRGFHVSPAVGFTIMHTNSTDIKCSTGSVATVSELFQITKNEFPDTIEEKDLEASQINKLGARKSVDTIVRYGEHETFNQSVERSNNDDTLKPAENPKSPFFGNTASAESWSSASKTAGVPVSMFKNGSGKREKTIEAVGDFNIDEDGNQMHNSIANIPNDWKLCKEVDNPIEVGIVNEAINEEGSRMQSEGKFHEISVTENQSENLLARDEVLNAGEEPSDVDSSRKMPEKILNDQSEVSDNSNTPTRPLEASSPGTEISKLMTSMSKSVSSIGCYSFMQKMDVERGHELVKPTIESSMRSKTNQEVSGTGSFVGMGESGHQLLFATPAKFEASCKAAETSRSERGSENIAYEGGFSTVENKSEKAINERLALATTNQESSGTDSKADKEENELHLLFATPIKIEDCCKDEITYDSETKSESVCFLEGVERVGYAGDELMINLSSGNELLPDGECMNNEALNLAKDVETTSAVSRVEASAGELTAKAFEQIKKISAIAEESVFTPSQTSCNKKASDVHCSAEKNILPASSVRNLDEIKCGKLPDTNLVEKLTPGNPYGRSEGKMEQSCEVAIGLSHPYTQVRIAENSHDYTAYCNESNSHHALMEPMNPEGEKVASIDGKKSLMMDQDTVPSPVSKASSEDGASATTEWKDMSLTVDEAVDNPRSEVEINCEAEMVKSHSASDAYHKDADILASDDESWSIVKETVDTMQYADNNVESAEHGRAILGAEVELFSSLEIHHLLAENNDNLEKSEGGPSNFNMKSGNETEVQDVDVDSMAIDDNQQVSIAELRLPGEVVHFSNDNLTVSNMHDEILKESDVADTIKEYINSESYVSTDIDDSGGTLHFEVLTNNGENMESEIPSNDDQDDTTSIETENEKEQFMMEPLPESKTAVLSPACVGLTTDEDCSDIQKVSQDIDFKDVDSSVLRQSRTAKKNARTILIHGTPSKPLTMADRKENLPNNKSSRIGDFTSVRPAKRRKALQDVPWK